MTRLLPPLDRQLGSAPALPLLPHLPPMHATRETWLHAAAREMSPVFDSVGAPLPARYRVSCGWPSVGALAKRKRRIGECWSDGASADGHTEIFVSPVLVEPVNVLATLLHELIHAAVGLKCGHRGRFASTAKMLGLTGKMTATVPSEVCAQWLDGMARRLGPYPHDRLDSLTNGRKKQSTRMLKLECPDCGYVIRTTAKWLDTGIPTCHCGGTFAIAGEGARDD